MTLLKAPLWFSVLPPWPRQAEVMSVLEYHITLPPSWRFGHVDFLSSEHGKPVLSLGPSHGLFPLPGVLFQLILSWRPRWRPKRPLPDRPVLLCGFTRSRFPRSTCHDSPSSCSRSVILHCQECTLGAAGASPGPRTALAKSRLLTLGGQNALPLPLPVLAAVTLCRLSCRQAGLPFIRVRAHLCTGPGTASAEAGSRDGKSAFLAILV